MYFGKPVIATAYSGNMDFCTEENCCLVGYQLIPVLPGHYPYASGQVWADPDIERAMWWMQRLVNDSELCRKKGQLGHDHIIQHHSAGVIGQHMVRRLRELA